MIASGPPTCLISQSGLPGLAFSLTGPCVDWAGEAPAFGEPPDPGSWQPATAAGIAAAPAAMPIKARRDWEGELMRPILPLADGTSTHDRPGYPRPPVHDGPNTRQHGINSRHAPWRSL